MALAHALRGDRPRALERVGQARAVAYQRRDTGEVEQTEVQIHLILSPSSWEEEAEEDADEE